MSNLSHANDSRLSLRRAPRWLLGLGGFLLVAQTGCPSDSKGPSPQQQCEALAEDICDKAVSCYSELSGEKATAQDRKDCVKELLEDDDCSKAVRVSDDYPKCIDAVQHADCEDVWRVDDTGEPVLNELPSVCEDVILTK